MHHVWHRYRAAYEEACAGTPEDALSRVLYACAPSISQLWELQRRLTSQLGLRQRRAHTVHSAPTVPLPSVHRGPGLHALLLLSVTVCDCL